MKNGIRLIFSFLIRIVGDDVVAGNLLRISCLRQQAVQLPAYFNGMWSIRTLDDFNNQLQQKDAIFRTRTM